MSTHTMTGSHGMSEHHGLWSLPSTAMAWIAFVLTVAIFPIGWALMSHAIDWPVLDTWVAPAFLTTLIDAAAITALVAYVRQKERSFLVLLSAIVAVPLALFATFFLGMHVVFPD